MSENPVVEPVTLTTMAVENATTVQLAKIQALQTAHAGLTAKTDSLKIAFDERFYDILGLIADEGVTYCFKVEQFEQSDQECFIVFHRTLEGVLLRECAMRFEGKNQWKVDASQPLADYTNNALAEFIVRNVIFPEV